VTESPPSQRRLVRSPSAVWRRLEGETVILDADTGGYFGLDEVGSRAWELIGERGGSLEGVVEGLLAEFDAGRAQVEADIRRLVGELEAHRLVSWSDA
jgi:hypothetical protein